MLLLAPLADHLPHETAHQWWGDLVSWRSYRDQWLSEGFAEYSQYLVPIPSVTSRNEHEAEDIRKALIRDKRERIDAMRRELLEPPQTELGVRKGRLADMGPIALGHRLETRETLGAYDALIYTKGALVLRMLHYMFSNPSDGSGEAFFEMMRDFVKLHENQPATTGKFAEIAGEHFAKTPLAQRYQIPNLNWFFSQWVDNSYLPSYRLEYTIENQNDRSAMLKGTIYQDNVPADFVTLLPVIARFSKDQTGQITAAARDAATTFSAKLPMPPEDVQLDPDHWILSGKTSARRVH
jgi:aminopeptidase N